ncbi:hypothetical protein ACFYNY_23990 [Streptomyces sp. NPDC006530]|uniref:hypothetical protein n=1 Tax=Streptomyces sp. NPDC006530 TaxID=3364750 RepID=UPI00367F8BC1
MNPAPSTTDDRSMQAVDESVLAYPEPPAHPNWHQNATTYGPLSPTQQKHNQQVLLAGLTGQAA